MVELEKENADLRARLDFATEQTRAILSQVRFLRQQAERPVTQAVVGNGEARSEKPRQSRRARWPMSDKRHVAKVNIVGEEYTIRSDATADHTVAVAAYLDREIRRC